MVKIPASSGLILSRINSVAVKRPANVPKQKARRVLTMGLSPIVTNFANKNAPKGKVPSTDKSAISNTLYVMNTPIAKTANTSPCSKDVINNGFNVYTSLL